MTSTSTTLQPIQPPHPWQLCGPALCHLVLYSSDLTSIRVRFPVLSRTRTAIGSGSRTSIRFDHPDCAPLHLRLAIANNYVGSIQVHGPQGVKLQDRYIFPPNPLPSLEEHPWIELKDGDIFYVAQWPFKFEQRWDLHAIDWNLFDLDSVTDAETRKLVIGCRELCKQTLKSDPPSDNDSSLDQNSDSVYINSPLSPSATISDLNLVCENNQDHIGILNPTDTTSSLPHPSDELRLDCPRSGSSSLSSDSESDEPQMTSQTRLPTRSSPRREQTPPRSSQAILKAPHTDLIPSKQCVDRNKQLRLVITPQKSNARLSWPLLASQPQSLNFENHTNPQPKAVESISPILEKEQPTPISPSSSDPDMTHVSFRRRSYRRSPEAVNQKRVRVNGPLLDDESSGEDDHGDDENENISQQLYRSPPSPGRRPSRFLPSPEASTSTSPQSPPAIGSTVFDPSQPTSPITPPDLRPRRKSLLQKILIKRAVEVHLAQTPEHPDPIGGCSGFSSSDEEDDEQAEEEDVGSTDEDAAEQGPNSTPEVDRDLGFTETVESPANPLPDPRSLALLQTTALASSSDSDDLTTQASRVFPSTNGKAQSFHALGVSRSPNSLLSPTRFSPTQSRRSVSPNAKLLAEYESREGSGQSSSPSPISVEFPLKSSFRRQSYTPEELQSFSTQPGAAHLQFTPSATQIRTALKYNTQLNSLSPSYTDEDEEQQRAERRRSLRSSTPGPSCSSFTPSPTKLTKIVNVQNETTSPHRLIRTPRSFLIKRGGSLTPLGVPFSRSPTRQHPIKPIEEDGEGEYELDESGKRKVRFDRDVFCLEFDKLPEELPKEPRSKKSKIEAKPEDSNQDSAPKPRGNRRRKASDPGNSSNSNRPRRASSRLSVPVSNRDHASRRARGDQSSDSIAAFQGREYSTINSSGGHTSVDDSAIATMPNQPDQNDSIISQIKQQFVNLGIGGNNSTRQRANSLPADVSRFANRNNTTEKTADPADLANEMKWLSLNTINTHPYLKQHSGITERPHSAPSSAYLKTTTTPRLKFPELSSFAPQLVGVREMILAPIQRLSLPHLDMSWKNIFTSWRDPVNPPVASLVDPQGDGDGEEYQSDDACSEDSVIIVINEDAFPTSPEAEAEHSDPLPLTTDVVVAEEDLKVDCQEDMVSSNTSSKLENVSADEDQRQTSKKPSRRKVASPPLSSNSNTRTLRSRSTNAKNGTSTTPEPVPVTNKRSNSNRTDSSGSSKNEVDNNPKNERISKAGGMTSPRKTRSRTRTRTGETEDHHEKKILDTEHNNNNNIFEIGNGNGNGLINNHNNSQNNRRRTQSSK